MDFNNPSFNNIVDAVYHLSLQEREELQTLLHNNISEARRDEIYQNTLQSKKNYKAGKLKSSSSIKELRKML